MSRYAPLPANNQHEEMDAAFGSDDEEDDDDVPLRRNQEQAQRAPLLPASSSSHPLNDDSSSVHRHQHTPSIGRRPAAPPGAYDFEYDYPPPPGSPPPPTAYGNTNGILPVEEEVTSVSSPNIFRRAFGAILPTHYKRDARGGGVNNDGVFANLSAKPSRAPVSDASGTAGLFMSPEEAQKDAPPVSYISISHIGICLTNYFI